MYQRVRLTMHAMVSSYFLDNLDAIRWVGGFPH